ncbi:MAG: DNA repair protein [Lachnospiraceae bacterium]|nr:DNA repair protein [Lachnospiraceae bacterium]
MENRIYLCIDLKSFYASVECVERKKDPMTTNLVVADPERERGTICLAVSPSMKALGVSNRCRVFQIPANIQYIMAPPRMQLYIDYSARIYEIYLKYIAKEDIHVYSIDEAFLDVTNYLGLYRMTATELGKRIMSDIKKDIGVVATCGIGTNLYLAKVALDITAKHSKEFIGYLDEELYQKTLWNHKPLTDFWRVGPGIARRLESVGIFNMEDVARADEKLLYRLLGIDAQYLIDHAWGREPVTMAEIKSYKARTNCLSSGQVLMHEYSYEDGLLIVKEMTDLLCLDLVEKNLVTDSISLYVGYAKNTIDSANSSTTMPVTTNSVRIITQHMTELYRRIVNTTVPIKRLNISFNNLLDEAYEQYDLFTDPREPEKDRKVQSAVLDIKKRFGKNAIIKGMDLQKNATTMERNRQIGGHKSGI